MASKLAVYETGYEDERFEQIVSETLHCIICTNVIKDPVMCQRNEHLFCRACITIHLMYSPTCPTCMEPLTVETLRQARTIMNLLSELKIRCEFVDRGCGKVVQLGDLERHVADCGFAPAVCSNEGCQLEVNKQDLLHHETAVCELRRVKCHSCSEIRREMDTMKVDLAAMNEKLDRNEARLLATLEKLEKNEKAVENAVAQGIKQIQDTIERKKSDEKLDRNEKTLLKALERIETNGKAVEKVAANIDLIQQADQEEKTKQGQGEINENLNLITKQLERIIQQTSSNVANQQNQTKEENLQKSPAIEKACKNDDAGCWNRGLTSSDDDCNYSPCSISSTGAVKGKAPGALTSSSDDCPRFDLLLATMNYSPRSSDSIPTKNSSTQAQKEKAAGDLTSSDDDSPRFNLLQAKNYSPRSSDSIPAKNSSTQAQKEKAAGDLTSSTDDSPRFNLLQAKKNYSPHSNDSIPAKNSSTQAQKDSPRFSYSIAVKDNSGSVRDFIPAKKDSPCLKHSTPDKDDRPILRHSIPDKDKEGRSRFRRKNWKRK